MLHKFVVFCVASTLPSVSLAQAASSSVSQFCAGKIDSVKFNDEAGFSDVAIRDEGVIKLFREKASLESDWAIYDTYSFMEKGGKRTAFSRTVLYADHVETYVEMQVNDGSLLTNKSSLEKGIFIPSGLYLGDLNQFCSLEVKRKLK